MKISKTLILRAFLLTGYSKYEKVEVIKPKGKQEEGDIN